jgi:hypothetical protein
MAIDTNSASAATISQRKSAPLSASAMWAGAGSLSRRVTRTIVNTASVPTTFKTRFPVIPAPLFSLGLNYPLVISEVNVR